jgi:LacI family transcriptional regulator
MAMQRLLRAAPTAVFAAGDIMAVGAWKTLRAVGMDIPEDVALVGFDDVSIASMIEPALTTVRQPIERMGAMAVDLLVSLLQGPLEEKTYPHKIILPTELVVRNSCGSIQN